MIGQTLLHYRITEKLGAGGMGEVWRATDMRLGRDVAIKVLPEAFARDPERVARFEREARVLASLNHPNIAAIHGFEQAGERHFLVLEYVPGPTLAEMIAGGPLEIDEALRLSRQIAEALEEAHDKAVVHRDLKPANVKVTPEGKVKVLDFGLAKALAGDPGDPSQSATLTVAATRAGVIMGTAAYMSPEQARGQRLDRRTDIWAFGCVLYEMLSGRRAFGGENITDIIAAIVTREPDWSKLPGATPAGVHRLLRRCLEKDPKDRLRDIGDSPILTETPAVVAPPPVTVRQSRPRFAALGATALLAALAAAAGVWLITRRPPSPAPPLMRFAVNLPTGEGLSGSASGHLFALSPDGARVAYVVQRGGVSHIYLRPIDQLEAKPIPGTDGGVSPFFSPDGQWLAFSQQARLKKVALSGGAPVTLGIGRLAGGGAWGPDDTIIFNDVIGAGLMRIPASGGIAQSLTTPAKGEIHHRWPEFLPGGKALLFGSMTGGGPETGAVFLQSLETGQRRLLIPGVTQARYAASGHLMFLRAGSLFAAPFDLARLEITGPAVPVLDRVGLTFVGDAAHFALSDTGTLVYAPGSGLRSRRLTWVDRRGSPTVLPAPPRTYTQAKVSPDGQRLALLIRDDNPDIWVYQVARGTLTRLTVEGGEDETPAWSPDGKTVAYSSSRPGQPRSIFARPADGGGAEERLWSGDHHVHLTAWSPDGKTIAYQESHPDTGWDLWVLPLEGDRKARPFLRTQFDERDAVFSPDGRWLAYGSTESGRSEVYVQAFPEAPSGPGAKTPISADGGGEPLWARNGRELFYRNGDKVMAVPVTPGSSFAAGAPRPLFEGQYDPWWHTAPDGQRFLMIGREQESGVNQLHFVLNWFDELRRRAPAGKR